ncbi:TetR family transcriptional regulator C-terminal domain-containing protein [Ornithinimicrobium cavernae]|uniref:TetR family transcriptional regulator C-terminal domain-containing protein n=1 Tax=Ornithinimicrobium cavernae TaxID=2666047 RepID=UPI000D692C71|nr:TetR family transcriptional regulator C-terminal domain-containing protein [Ornithinimicrobium cavernae]
MVVAPRIALSDRERSDLRRIADSPASSTRLATRARIVLALEQNWRTKDVAEALGVSAPTVALWRKRFLEGGVDGLSDKHEPSGSEAELQRLLDAAERTVSKRGFCATRISDIAFEAGVSPSSIMYYFDSRQETLVRAMLHANQRAAVNFEQQVLEGGLSPVERLAAFLKRVLPIEGSQRDEYLLELDLLAHARQYPEFIGIWDEYQRRWIAGLASIIEEGIAAGAFKPSESPHELLAAAALAMIDGFGYQLAVGATIVPREAMLDSVADYLSLQLGVPIEMLRA